MRTKYFIEASRDSVATIYSAGINAENKLVSVCSKSLEVDRLQDDNWEFKFNFSTASGKKTVKLGYCEIDEILKLYKIWKTIEPVWENGDYFGVFEEI